MSSITSALDFVRKLPASPITERELIATILYGHEASSVIFATLHGEFFTSSIFRIIFCVAKKLHTEGKPFDTVAVADAMSCRDLEDVGGLQGLSEIATDTFAKYDAAYACSILSRKARQRNLIGLLEKVQNDAWADHADPDHLADTLSQELAALRAQAPTANRSAELRTYTPAELAALVTEPIEHVAYPIALRGMLSVVDGAAKASGKTTLLLHAIRSVLRGEIFLNRPTKKVNVLLVSEENKRTLNLALDRVDLSSETSGLHTLPRESWAGIAWPILAERLEQKCIELDVGWLITDTFFAVCGLGGDQENEAGTVDQAVAPLRNIAGKLDTAVTLTRHERKSGGEIGQSGRGSSALTGACDVILQLRRLSASYGREMRQLEITGRIDPDRLTIKLSLGRYVSHEHGDARSSTAEELEILDAAIQTDPTRSIRELANLTGINKNRITKLAARTGWQKSKVKGKPWTQSKP